MRHGLRWLALLGLLAGVVPLVPLGVAAADVVVRDCDEDQALDQALEAVREDGGTITITCDDPIPFRGEKEISSPVTILGGGAAVFDGQNSTRLFGVTSQGTLTLVGVTLQNGAVGGTGHGGAIYNDGTLTVMASTFRNNRASNGGAISGTGTLTVTASTFSGNSADEWGGAIHSFAVGTVTVTASTFSGNSADEGGAIYSTGTLTVTASTFNDNSATFGGAISNDGDTVTVTVTASTFSDNRAGSFGGAIHNARGTVTVTASTFSGNRAGSFGGAIRTYDGTLTVTASTFNDNGAAWGGAIGNTHDSTVMVTASTFSGNSANSGGAINTFLGVARLRGTILAGNGGGNCGGDRVTAEGYNLSDDSSCSGIPSSSNINLGELTDNGGPTLTMLPANDSPAIDAIPEAECSTHSTPTDQRGALRPAGAGCDIGAVEADASVPLQRFAAEASGGPEGQPLPIIAAAAGSSESPLSYQVDCDNDDEYETEGITKPLGEASASIGLATCTFADEGEYPVGLKTCSGDDCLTTAFSVTVHNVAPALETPVVTPTPSKEGELVEVSVAFTDAGSQDTHTCTIDYGDGSAPEDGTVDQEEGTCTGQHTYRDDASNQSGGTYRITITVTDDAGASASSSVEHTVENLPPEIHGITLGPVVQHQPVLVTVAASDPGDDTLSYRFDCDDDGDYDIGPQEEPTASCALDPSRAQTTITVLVEDDDGGWDTGSVVVSQAVTLCADRYTGGLTGLLANGGCPPTSSLLVLPAVEAQTLCINRYTAALSWAPRGNCAPTTQLHLLPEDGPLPYCQNRYTGALRYTLTGACTSVERPGVIPGL